MYIQLFVLTKVRSISQVINRFVLMVVWPPTLYTFVELRETTDRLEICRDELKFVDARWRNLASSNHPTDQKVSSIGAMNTIIWSKHQYELIYERGLYTMIEVYNTRLSGYSKVCLMAVIAYWKNKSLTAMTTQHRPT